MDKYILQLVDDMRESAKHVPDIETLVDEADLNLPEEFEMFADVELYLHGPQQKLSAITGIETAEIPPVEKLNETQATFLLDEMVRLLEAYCFYPVFPEGMSLEQKYRLLHKEWENEYVLISTGHNVIEFCCTWPPDCPRPQGFCECRDFYEEE